MGDDAWSFSSLMAMRCASCGACDCVCMCACGCDMSHLNPLQQHEHSVLLRRVSAGEVSQKMTATKLHMHMYIHIYTYVHISHCSNTSAHELRQLLAQQRLDPLVPSSRRQQAAAGSKQQAASSSTHAVTYSSTSYCVTNVKALPLRPARCKYVSDVLGKSKLMTTLTLWMSMPRVKRSLHTRLRTVPSRKAWNT